MARIEKYRSKQHLVEKYNNTVKYLDDILTPNIDYFNIYNKDIYPQELSLKKANTDNQNKMSVC